MIEVIVGSIVLISLISLIIYNKYYKNDKMPFSDILENLKDKY